MNHESQSTETQTTIAQTIQPADTPISIDLSGIAQLYPELFPWWMSTFAIAYLIQAIAKLLNGDKD